MTSEQAPHRARAYSVRKLAGPGELVTVGEFNAYTKAAANGMAKRLAAKEENAS